MPTNRIDHEARFKLSKAAQVVIFILALIAGEVTHLISYDSSWWSNVDIETGHVASWLLTFAVVFLTRFVLVTLWKGRNRSRARRERNMRIGAVIEEEFCRKYGPDPR